MHAEVLEELPLQGSRTRPLPLSFKPIGRACLFIRRTSISLTISLADARKTCPMLLEILFLQG